MRFPVEETNAHGVWQVRPAAGEGRAGRSRAQAAQPLGFQSGAGHDFGLSFTPAAWETRRCSSARVPADRRGKNRKAAYFFLAIARKCSISN
jgi:hypothetical protein